ncbi:MAG: hypothetical protein LJE65_09090, partial [Desulfobacteraceae bacterium]|nr:hypothetical protein [Desulfobacteraceae bacterium]
AAGLPEGLAVAAIVDSRIRSVQQRQKVLAGDHSRKTALEIYEQIAADIAASSWQRAQVLIEENRTLLDRYLPERQQEHLLILSAFFADIAAADRILQQTPIDESRVARAAEGYRRASETAAGLPPELDASPMAAERIDALESLRKELAARRERQIAQDIYRSIIDDMTPAAWEQARTRLEENHLQIAVHLEPEARAEMLALIDFFRDVQVGERLLQTRPMSETLIEAAEASFLRAGKTAEALIDTVNLRFIVRQKQGEAKRLRVALIKQNEKAEAMADYRQLLEIAGTERWPEALREIRDRRRLLEENLTPEQWQTIRQLSAVLEAIEKGDEKAGAQPGSIEFIDEAEGHYRKALTAAASLPPEIDIAGLVQPRLDTMSAQRSRVAAQNRKESAVSIYHAVVSALEPDRWEQARRLLAKNRELLADALPRQESRTVEQLLQLTVLLEDVDRILGQKPIDRQRMDEALARFQEAEKTVDALAPVADLSFLMEEPRQEIKRQKESVEWDRKQRLAEKIFHDAQERLNPGDWEEAKRICLQHLRLLIPYLGDEGQSAAQLLVAFFQDIDEADRIRRSGEPHSWDRAAALYREAEDKAIALSNRWDLLFVTEQRLAENEADRSAAERKEAAAAAKPPTTTASASVRIPRIDRPKPPAVAAGTYEPKTALRMAMKHFDSNRYDDSLDLFRSVYGRQIAKLEQGGKKQVAGILGISPEFRAEVLFLVELERIRRRAGENAEKFQRGLRELVDAMNAGVGPWSITSDAERARLRRHLENLGL